MLEEIAAAEVDEELARWLALEELGSASALVALELDVVAPVLPLAALASTELPNVFVLGPGVLVPASLFAAPAAPELSTVVESSADDVDSELSVPPCEFVVEVSPPPQAKAAPAPMATESADRRENFIQPLGEYHRTKSRVVQWRLPERSNTLVLDWKTSRITRNEPMPHCKHSMTADSRERKSRSRGRPLAPPSSCNGFGSSLAVPPPLGAVAQSPKRLIA